MKLSSKDIDKLSIVIAKKLREMDEDEVDEETLDEEETFHLIVDNVNEDDLDYILITPNKLTISTRRGVYDQMDEVIDFLDENFEDYPE